MQQAASSVLGMSPGKTMKLAQSLYEKGFITYMRSDSVNVSEQARAAAKDFIVSNYGGDFYPGKPNVFKSKSSAQEAHEAIRPTDVQLTPQRASMDASELKLYDLIWRRFVASQMSDAKTTVKTLCIEARKPALAHQYLFTASATEINCEGFLKVMKLSLSKKRSDGEDDEDSDEVARLPDVKIGERLEAVRWIADEKQTKGPAHYSEASLIKALDPSLNPRVGDISDAHEQGRHTTTFYEMYRIRSAGQQTRQYRHDGDDAMGSAGFIVDTPGLRGFGLVDLKKEEIALYFPEMLKAAENCRFAPCTHTHEPGCAVKEAVENGDISYDRYSSYLGMLDEEGKYR
jgi:DNA topoisomerase IA